MSNFNKEQLIAINHKDKPMLVVAGPGSGKTTVIVNRVKTLLDSGVSGDRILVITFTKLAALEMKTRFLKVFNMGERRVTFSTFHSLFFKILKQTYNLSQEDIILEDQKFSVIEKICKDNNIKLDNSEDKIKKIINEIGVCKNCLCEPENFDPSSVQRGEFLEVIKAYDNYKKVEKKLDFDDMAQLCYNTFTQKPQVLEFWKNKYDYILIDEFQDINTAQYECVKLINRTDNIFVVGDDDQSIYKFRGAKPEFLKYFRRDFSDCVQVVLDTNYRSTEEIIKLTNKIILKNKTRINKEIKGTVRVGKKPIILESETVTDEAKKVAQKVLLQNSKGVAFEEMSVIYRTNIQARAFVDVFTELSIPYVLRDTIPLINDHFIAKDVFAYLKLALDINDNESALRIINKPNRYIARNLVVELSKQGNLIYNIIYESGLEPWQLKKFSEITQDISVLKHLPPFECILYIRRNIGLDDYVKDLAEYKNISTDGIFEVLNELQEKAKQYETIEQFFNGLEVEKQLILESYKNNPNSNEEQKGVVLTTLHSSKGLEFETVFVVGAVDGLIPLTNSKGKTTKINELEEERRLFYVGLTRAKTNLYISYSKTRYEEPFNLTQFLKMK